MDSKLTPFVQGGFKPVSREFQETKVRIHGRLPTDMLGFYLKNGPNAQFPPKRGQPYHWFDGDGMVHSLRLNGAKNEAIFVNRWVRTERFNRDKDRGDTVFSFGEMQSGNMMAMLDPRGVNEKTQRIIGRMQTNVVYHGGKLLALEETDQPYEMQLPSLSTVGQCTFQGTLNHVMCAHPKLCPQTKEMFLFGHSIDPGLIQKRPTRSYHRTPAK
jgi:carotenoid cleavage dioxygenase-like enzyme